MNSKGQIAAHDLKNKLYHSQWEFLRFGAMYWMDIDKELDTLQNLKSEVLKAKEFTSSLKEQTDFEAGQLFTLNWVMAILEGEQHDK